MGKKATKDDPLEKAERKLARSQIKLGVAEEKHSQERERGKQEIEQARLRAAKWLARAAERVERRRAAVIRAESRLEHLAAESTERGASPERSNGLALAGEGIEAGDTAIRAPDGEVIIAEERAGRTASHAG